ncbi:hypothetical protein RFI_20333, partial [Reticulomyxa filosa]
EEEEGDEEEEAKGFVGMSPISPMQSPAHKAADNAFFDQHSHPQQHQQSQQQQQQQQQQGVVPVPADASPTEKEIDYEKIKRGSIIVPKSKSYNQLQSTQDFRKLQKAEPLVAPSQIMILGMTLLQLVIWMLMMRYFARQPHHPLHYPIIDLTSRVLHSVGWTPFYYGSLLGTLAVLYRSSHPGSPPWQTYRTACLSLLSCIIAIDAARVGMATCTSEIAYQLCVLAILAFILIVPFFTHARHEASNANWLRTWLWIVLLLLFFAQASVRQNIDQIVYVIFFFTLLLWTYQTIYHATFLVDDKGHFQLTNDVGFASILVSMTLLLPYLGIRFFFFFFCLFLSNKHIFLKKCSAYFMSINSWNKSPALIWTIFAVNKIIFWIVRILWEQSAMQATTSTRYLYIMFPVFFLEELIDILLVLQITFARGWWIMLLIISISHIARDSDIWYHRMFDKCAMQKLPLLLIFHNKKFHCCNCHKYSKDIVDLQHVDSVEHLTDNKHFVSSSSSTQTIQCEGKEIRLSRVILHWQMLFFCELCARAVLFMLLVIENLCDKWSIGHSLLTDNIIGKSANWALLGVVTLSMLLAIVTYIINEWLIGRRAFTSIEIFKDIVVPLTNKQKAFFHMWLYFGDDGNIWTRFWAFFGFVAMYELSVVLSAFVTPNPYNACTL